MKKTLILLLLFSSYLDAQEVGDEQCLLLTRITDFDTIPQPYARMIIWTKNDSLAFNKETKSDIEGKSSFVLEQGNEYYLKVFKADTSKVFKLLVDKKNYPFSIEWDMFIEVTRRYSQIFELEVNFDTNSAIIPDESKSNIDDLYDRLMNDPEVSIELASHTDSIGDDNSNMLLSQRRSESVKQYLIDMGIELDRIEAQGYGEKQPKATNETPEGRAKNRRTEVRISIVKNEIES